MNGTAHAVIASPTPPISTQRTVDGKTRYTCWADAWISWVAARPQQPWWLPPLRGDDPDSLQAGKQALFEQYAEWIGANGAFQAAGDMGRFGIGLLLAGANMDVQLFKKSAGRVPPPAREMGLLTGQFLAGRLKKGHVFAFFAGNQFAPVSTGHAVVIYGIAHSGSGFTLKVMDPWPGQGHVVRNLDYFTASQQMVVGWPGI